MYNSWIAWDLDRFDDPMSAPGLFERGQEDLTVTVGGKPSELTFKQLLKRIAELLFEHRTWQEWKASLHTRRHPDTHDELDYEFKLRELEGQIEQIDREQRGFRMGDYHEKDKHSWKDWILGVLALLIVAWLGRISMQMDELTKVVVKQETDEQRLDRLESHVFRGAP